MNCSYASRRVLSSKLSTQPLRGRDPWIRDQDVARSWRLGSVYVLQVLISYS